MDLTPLILNPNSFDLDALPPELIYQVCSQMSTENLQNMVKTSHKVHDICDDILKTREPVWLDPKYRKSHKITAKQLKEINTDGDVRIVRDKCADIIDIFRQELIDKEGSPVYFLGLGRGIGTVDTMKNFLITYFRQHHIKRMGDDPLWFNVMFNRHLQDIIKQKDKYQSDIDRIDDNPWDDDDRDFYLQIFTEGRNRNSRHIETLMKTSNNKISVWDAHAQIDKLISYCTEKALVGDLIGEELNLIKEDVVKMEKVSVPRKKSRIS